jgi:hypothetical protein
MLQLPALAAWNHPEAERYRSAIDFTGIFVPADVSWGAQLSALGNNKLSPKVVELLGLSAFTSHVLIALIEAMRDCTAERQVVVSSLAEKYVSLTKADEVELCQQIAANWQLSPVLPTFYGVKLALRERLSEIAQISRLEMFRQDQRAGRDYRPIYFFTWDFSSALRLRSRRLMSELVGRIEFGRSFSTTSKLLRKRFVDFCFPHCEAPISGCFSNFLSVRTMKTQTSSGEATRRCPVKTISQ